MIAMAMVGALLGAAVVLLLTRLVPLRPSPLVQLGQLDARHRGQLPAGRTGQQHAATRSGDA